MRAVKYICLLSLIAHLSYACSSNKPVKKDLPEKLREKNLFTQYVTLDKLIEAKEMMKNGLLERGIITIDGLPWYALRAPAESLTRKYLLEQVDNLDKGVVAGLLAIKANDAAQADKLEKSFNKNNFGAEYFLRAGLSHTNKKKMTIIIEHALMHQALSRKEQDVGVAESVKNNSRSRGTKRRPFTPTN